MKDQVVTMQEATRIMEYGEKVERLTALTDAVRVHVIIMKFASKHAEEMTQEETEAFSLFAKNNTEFFNRLLAAYRSEQ